MKDMASFKDHLEVREFFKPMADKIRSGDFPWKRPYALSTLQAVMEAVHCNYSQIALVELGVAGGRGLLQLCRIAELFTQELNIDIQVYGFDTGVGLPPVLDYRDHPEFWSQGLYSMGDVDALRKRLPEFCHLIIGNLSETIPSFLDTLGTSRRIGFVSVDVDYYSSTVSGLKIFEYPPSAYLPAVPMYFDDVEVLLTYSPWSGEALAISEFNTSHEKRKIERKNWRILKFHVCHILDHPIRTGSEQPRIPLIIFDI